MRTTKKKYILVYWNNKSIFKKFVTMFCESCPVCKVSLSNFWKNQEFIEFSLFSLKIGNLNEAAMGIWIGIWRKMLSLCRHNWLNILLHQLTSGNSEKEGRSSDLLIIYCFI